MGINRCSEVGCTSCCHDITGDVSKKELAKAFPCVQVAGENPTEWSSLPPDTTIAQDLGRRTVELMIKGLCGNNKYGTCVVYKKRPNICRNGVKYGSTKCDEFRKRDGLLPVKSLKDPRHLLPGWNDF